MDLIIKYATQSMLEVDNYVDDLIVPKTKTTKLSKTLSSFGLPTKPAERLPEARVLGLQLHEMNDIIRWSSRDQAHITLPEDIT